MHWISGDWVGGVQVDSVASIAGKSVEGELMATLTIRDLDDELRAQLRVRAARHGRSMEAEVRAILRDALVRPPALERLGSRVHQRFAAVGGAELELPSRRDAPRSAQLPK